MGDLHKHYQTFDHFLRKSKKEFENHIKNDMVIQGNIQDFNILKILGTGSFGKVVLCKHVAEGDKLYAMKIMEKINIIKNKQLLHTISEIRFLEAFKFPFIVGLMYFFKNNVYIFIVMPFIAGGEMFYHLRSMKKFEESLSKFYAAQVIMAFEYMHALGVVYRDLKPENILIDVDGYLKITDLGFCKKIDNTRTFTLCGTPEYLAPEIILSQGYNYSVDWWALGVLIYEMAAGFPPFYSKEHMKLYEKIVSGRFACPPHFTKPLKDLILNILQVDRTKRYGQLKGGSKDIKGHDWFRGTDWDGILSKRVKSPFEPTLDNVGDTKYFETYGDIVLRESINNEYADEFADFSVGKKGFM
ncbi:unnamed protein product [Acanthoscelides obtectus]|uniref:cAMP-dependent protein kinase n=1 Tax=Acanthoscelides obtectus TaxID=200917 RepID=A0A9P0P6H2_ACAOB|nr:unnamed protein product [Acanthoscelides obtectus]CAK1653181.1 cAMP-dependent protein kinase catalytic subunit [Acanthoscelides obtectus]